MGEILVFRQPQGYLARPQPSKDRFRPMGNPIAITPVVTIY
jgi:hypothetical protein